MCLPQRFYSSSLCSCFPMFGHISGRKKHFQPKLLRLYKLRSLELFKLPKLQELGTPPPLAHRRWSYSRHPAPVLLRTWRPKHWLWPRQSFEKWGEAWRHGIIPLLTKPGGERVYFRLSNPVIFQKPVTSHQSKFVPPYEPQEPHQKTSIPSRQQERRIFSLQSLNRKWWPQSLHCWVNTHGTNIMRRCLHQNWTTIHTWRQQKKRWNTLQKKYVLNFLCKLVGCPRYWLAKLFPDRVKLTTKAF